MSATRVTDQARVTRVCCAGLLAASLCSVLLFSACERSEALEPPATPVANTAHPALAQLAASDCARCHAQIAAEWRDSGHANAWSDPLVAREYLADPDPSCVACHAPLALAGELPSGRAAHDGIDCVGCHLHEGELLPAPQLARAEACGSCHQFRFLPVPPDPSNPGLAYDPEAWLQDTLGEWSRSRAAAEGIGCRDCHMPWVGQGRQRHRAHAFPGMRDPELVAQAVTVQLEAQRQGGQVHVQAELEGAAIGHAFPTGDLFRRAVLRVWTQERESASDSFSLQRSFAAAPQTDPDQPAYLEEVLDTRVPPPGAGAPLHVEFRLRSPAAQRVGWSLELHATTHSAGSSAAHSVPATPVASGSVAIHD